MACRGVHFALTEQEVETLKALKKEEERLGYLQERIEETYFGKHPELLAESDKALDAMHRTLSDDQLTWDKASGSEPF